MKTTERFKDVIEEHLKYCAFKDPLFAESLKKPGKNLDDCVTYILNTVQKSGSAGFTDEEIFGMAKHYYDEDDIDVGKPVNRGKVVVNHHIKLTQAEKEEARKKAIDELVEEEKSRMRKSKKPQKTEDKKAEDSSAGPTLF